MQWSSILPAVLVMAKIEFISEQLGIAKVVENCPRAVGDCKPFYSHLHVPFAFQSFLLYGPLRAEYNFGMIDKRKLFKMFTIQSL